MPGQYRHLGLADHRMDAALGQVGPIIKVLQHRRLLQPPHHLDAISVIRRRVNRNLHQHPALHGAREHIRGGQLFGRHAQVSGSGPPVGFACHHPGERDGSTVSVISGLVRSQGRLRYHQPPGAQEQSSQRPEHPPAPPRLAPAIEKHQRHGKRQQKPDRGKQSGLGQHNADSPGRCEHN